MDFRPEVFQVDNCTIVNVPKNNPTELSASLLDKLKEIDVCTLCHGLVDLGYRNTYMRGIKPLAMPVERTYFLGFARTLRFVPLREDLVESQYSDNTRSPHRTALESIQPGEVLIIDTGGCTEAGVIGDIFTRRVKYRGGEAIVVDGVIRDLANICSIGFPVFGRGIHGAGINRHLMSAGVDEPVNCGGVAVVPGDLIMGDADGVIAIPPHKVEELVNRFHPSIEMEEWIRGKILKGADLHHYYQHPPRPEVLEEFRRETSSMNERAALSSV